MAIGVGATVVMDATAEVLRVTRGVRSLDYALVGRWLGHMRHGRFRHQPIGDAPPTTHERAVGWGAHYAIGTSFAVVLVAVDPAWLDAPGPFPAVATGLATLAAPWFIMQPAFGLGVAASRTPDPSRARLGSVRAHVAYGMGLWASGLVVTGVARRVAG